MVVTPVAVAIALVSKIEVVRVGLRGMVVVVVVVVNIFVVV